MIEAIKRRKLFVLTLLIFIVIVAVYTVTEIYMQRDYLQEFVKRKEHLFSIKETTLEPRPGHSMTRIELENGNGIKVEGLIKVPLQGNGLYPVLFMLGGLRTGKRIVEYVGDTEGIILLALDYPYEGKRSEMSKREFLTKIPDMRRAVMNTVPAAMLCMDYLAERNDVDQNRIVLIGGSLGALFVPAIAAAEPRFRAVAVLFGAGDLQSLIYANLELPSPVAAVASWAGALLVSPLEPLKYIGRISPRPLFILNGTDDPRIPRRCSILLQEKAGDPKTVRWIKSGHLYVRSMEFQRLVRSELRTWLLDYKLVPPNSIGPVSFINGMQDREVHLEISVKSTRREPSGCYPVSLYEGGE